MQNTTGDIDITQLDSLHWSHTVGEVSHLYLRRGQKNYHQHVKVDSMDDIHEHKRPEKDVREVERIQQTNTHTLFHPVWLNTAVGLVNQRPPQEKISSATLPAESRRYCTQGADTGRRKRDLHTVVEETENVQQELDSWTLSSRAAAPLMPNLLYCFDLIFIYLTQATE